MKILTLDRCRDCPSYIPDSFAYHDEYGRCDRVRAIWVKDDSKNPELWGCPLKDWKE